MNGINVRMCILAHNNTAVDLKRYSCQQNDISDGQSGRENELLLTHCMFLFQSLFNH